MSKTLKTGNLNSRPMVRTLVAVSLSISLAAFGCTTDRTLGNGDPVVTPGVRTSPTGNTSTGSETTPTVPAPMFSSSIDNGQALPAVRPRASRADQAAAVIADQAPRVRYLGVAMPGQSGRGYFSDANPSGQFQNPALRTNPQLTVNSSISSSPTPVIASGAGEGVAGGGVSGAAVVTGNSFASTTGASTVIGTGAGLTTGVGTTASSTATGTSLGLGGNANGGAAPIFTNSSSVGLSPTAAATLPLGTLAATATPTTSPTAFSGLNPPTAISGFPALAANSTVTQSALANNNNNSTVINGTNTATTANVTSGTTNATTGTITTGSARTNLRAATRATTAARGTGGTAITSSSTVTGTTTTGRTTNPVRLTRDASGRLTITNNSAQRNR
jgi:hypothetical protein